MNIDFGIYDGKTYIYPLKDDVQIGDTIMSGALKYEILEIDEPNGLMLIVEIEE